MPILKLLVIILSIFFLASLGFFPTNFPISISYAQDDYPPDYPDDYPPDYPDDYPPDYPPDYPEYPYPYPYPAPAEGYTDCGVVQTCSDGGQIINQCSPSCNDPNRTCRNSGTCISNPPSCTSNSQCSIGSGPAGQSVCDGNSVCSPVCNTSTGNCGTNCTACPSGQTCSNGTCVGSGSYTTPTSSYTTPTSSYTYPYPYPAPSSCTPITSPPNLINPADRANVTGTQVRLDWAQGNATRFDVRVDDGTSSDTSNEVGGTANNCSPHDVCINGWTNNSMIVTVQSGRTYNWWVHPRNDCTTADYSSLRSFNVVTCTNTNPGTNQFIGCLYDGINFNTLIENAPSGPTQTSPVEDNPPDNRVLRFDWVGGSPNSSLVGDDTFSLNWKSNFTFKPGTYTFYMASDDGTRLYLDSNLILDRWTTCCATWASPPQTFNTQSTHLLELQYNENGGAAAVNLRWTYTPFTYTLTTTKTGTGEGTVTASGGSGSDTTINCGADCSGTYNSGSSVTVTATPSAGSIFAGWSNCSTSTSSSITVTMDAVKTCTANFTALPDLLVSSAGAPPPYIISGTNRTFSSTVQNTGGSTAGVSTTRFWLNTGVPFADMPTNSLAASGTHALTTPQWTAAAGNYNLTIQADIGGVISESNEVNNTNGPYPFSVYNPLTVTCSPAAPSVLPNQDIRWNGTPTGGRSTTYSYTWSFSGSGGPTCVTPATNCHLVEDPVVRYSTAGTKTAILQVNDGVQNVASNPCTLDANYPAWLKTTGGDVHSNTNISTPGGP